MGEHLLPSKLISSFVCGVNKLHIPIIRVCPPQERVRGWQDSHFRQSGAAKSPYPHDNYIMG